MPFERNIHWLDRGRVLAECGPMRLVIAAWLGQVPQRQTCVRAAEESFLILQRIAKVKGLLARRLDCVPESLDDFLAQKMVRSVLAVGDLDLTPMAAVAGTIADAVADFIINYGMTRAIVDNGGDIALRIRSKGVMHVGIRPDVQSPEIAHIIVLGDERPAWGVATSGLGGRSLTRGLASAATVIAGQASTADAAATAIANACFVEDDSVEQKMAEEIDENTDIPGIPVTIKVGPLIREKKKKALSRALDKANSLIAKKLILGAYVALGGESVMTDFVRNRLLD